jgi:hypothetical protein
LVVDANEAALIADLSGDRPNLSHINGRAIESPALGQEATKGDEVGKGWLPQDLKAIRGGCEMAAISSRALEANIEALPDACDCFFGSAHPCSKAAEIASMTAGESGASEVKFAVR